MNLLSENSVFGYSVIWLLSLEVIKQFSIIYFLLFGLNEMKAVFGLTTPISVTGTFDKFI
jgi:hypothetical protein